MKLKIISYIHYETNTLYAKMLTPSEKINTDECVYAGIILLMSIKKPANLSWQASGGGLTTTDIKTKSADTYMNLDFSTSKRR